MKIGGSYINTDAYSIISAWVAYLFSLYGLVILYINASYFWPLIAGSLVLTFISLCAGIQNLINLFYSPIISKFVAKILIRSISLGYFLSSAYGFIYFIIKLPFNDKSIFILPCLAVIFIFGGSAVGILERK